MASDHRQRTPEQQHRREVWRSITLPMLAVIAVMAVLILLVALAASPVQFSLIADFMLTIFIVVPIALSCLIPTLLFMAAAIGLWKLNSVAARPLRRGRRSAIGLLAGFRQQVPRAAAPVIKMQEFLSRWERFLPGRVYPVSTTPSEEHLHDH